MLPRDENSVLRGSSSTRSGPFSAPREKIAIFIPRAKPKVIRTEDQNEGSRAILKARGEAEGFK
jgi:hypothetical protein